MIQTIHGVRARLLIHARVPTKSPWHSSPVCVSVASLPGCCWSGWQPPHCCWLHCSHCGLLLSHPAAPQLWPEKHAVQKQQLVLAMHQWGMDACDHCHADALPCTANYCHCLQFSLGTQHVSVKGTLTECCIASMSASLIPAISLDTTLDT
jgi:hypothetical protein